MNTKQGYARCDVLPLESAGKAVTADRGMAKALTENRIDVMVIRPGGIALDGCEYGFIGGASAPVVIPIIAAGHGFGFAIGCVACIYVVAFIAMFFLPEKKGSDLE